MSFAWSEAQNVRCWRREAPHSRAASPGLRLSTARVAVAMVLRASRLRVKTLIRFVIISLTTVRTVSRTHRRTSTHPEPEQKVIMPIDRHHAGRTARGPLATEESRTVSTSFPFEASDVEKPNRAFRCHSMRQRRHLLIQPSAYTAPDLGPNNVEHPGRDTGRDGSKDDKRRNSACQRPSVDLHIYNVHHAVRVTRNQNRKSTSAENRASASARYGASPELTL